MGSADGLPKLTLQFGLQWSAGLGGVAARNQPALTLWMALSPLPQFPLQRKGEQQELGCVCMFCFW